MSLLIPSKSRLYTGPSPPITIPNETSLLQAIDMSTTELTPKWPARLKDDGQSLMQLVTHEYILRLIDTPEGIPGKGPVDVRLNAVKTPEEATRAFAGVITACQGFQIGNLEFTTSTSPMDPKDRDVTHAKRLLDHSTALTKNITELDREQFHVGIIGAGMGGLYTAMILKTLGIPYEILEASDRIGGRVYTHRFSNDPGDYYDAGAMRFPDTPIMNRTFRLFSQLGIEKKSDITFDEFCTKDINQKRKHIQLREYRRDQSQKHGDLIPYHLAGNNMPSYFNDRLVIVNPTGVNTSSIPGEVDLYSFGTAHGGSVPNECVALNPASFVDMIFETWRDKFRSDPYPTLTELYEKDKRAVTVRQEMMERLETEVYYSLEKPKSGDTTPPLKRKLTPSERYHVSNWCETMTGSTCRFDGALLESFIHSLDFNYPVVPGFDPPVDVTHSWWCLNGGTDILAQEMTKNVGENTITKNARVTAIRKHPVPSLRPMRVLLEGNPTERRFSHVITTTTTPCLQAMDLTGVRLQTDQREAIRVLRYEAAVKLGIKFSKKWWIEMGINKGGQGKTDRPTRIVVYPSYALEDSADYGGVLLACYNSSTDAIRIGALARGNDPTNQQLILDVVLHDLALMHDKPYTMLRDLVVAHHFHDWSRNEFSVGAWGDFAPGQFSNFFTSLQVPAAGGNLFFAGELTSIYHGWIVASLNSAHRAVYLMLLKEKKYDLLEKMTARWGNLTEHDIPSALCFVALAERGEEFASLREMQAVEREKKAETARQEAAEEEKKKQLNLLIESLKIGEVLDGVGAFLDKLFT